MPSAQRLPSINHDINNDETGPPKPGSGKSSRRGLLSTKAADLCLDWVIFPAILFVQFGATMYFQMKQGLLVMDWMVVNATILLFCVVAGLYRKTLRANSESIVLLLLPEIFTNILLALVMLGDVTTAYVTLVALTVLLGVIGTVLSIWARGSGLALDYQQLPRDAEEEDDDEWVC